MTHSLSRNVLVLACFVAAAQFSTALAEEVKAPVWKHGMDLKVRKAGEKEFTKTTQSYGVEVFADPNTDKLVYITETGSLAALNGSAPGQNTKDPEWLHGLELRVRKDGEADFSDKTKKYGVEVYRDENAGNLIYITETGSIAVLADAKAIPAGDTTKPLWRHGLQLPVRKAGEKEFTKTTKRYGMEVFVDAHNGNVVYITETGAIAVISGAGLPARPEKVITPEWMHAMELKVRNAGVSDFNDSTPKIGLEVYQDANTNKLILLTETGAISLLNGTTTDSNKKDPEWKHGLEMAARKSGQKDFDKATTPSYGIEVYTDAIVNAMLYADQVGSVSAIPLK